MHGKNLFKMSNNKYTRQDIETTPGWDARQHYTWRMCEIAWKCILSDWRDTKGWLENVKDFKNWVNPILKRAKVDVEPDLKHIHKLVYSERNPDGSMRDKTKDFQDAHIKLREVFEKIQDTLFQEGMYIPMNEYYDEFEGFKNQYK